MQNPESTSIFFPLEQPELRCEQQGTLVRRTVHPSGLRVLTEQVPGAKSVSIGFWVQVGSRDEEAEADSFTHGSTHFLEHLLFKGTPTRNAYEIADAFDRIGADHNALTAKEYTCYHAKVRDRDLPIALETLADMVFASVLEEHEFETERGVILEELAMAADDLSDVVHERFFEALFGAHPLARPIGGTVTTIQQVQREAVWQHYVKHYVPSTLVVTAAGAVEHETLVEQLLSCLDRATKQSELFARWSPTQCAAPAARRPRAAAEISAGTPYLVHRKPSEQVHLVQGTRGYRTGEDDRFAFGLMNSVLGGGMSSRLFQEIREKRGLAYSAYSFGGSYSDAGAFGMYAACNPEKAQEVLQVMRGELERMAERGVSEDERQRALGQISGSSALALEDSDTRMGRLARAELGTGELLDLETSIARFAAVTNDDIIRVAADLAARPSTSVAVGAVLE